MERIKIAEESRSPYVLFDGDKATFEIGGISAMEDAKAFYAPLIEALGKFKEEYKIPLDVTFDFHAFNTSSARQILALMREMAEVPSIIRWVYEMDDEDMLEAGEDYQNMIGVNFVFEEKEVE